MEAVQITSATNPNIRELIQLKEKAAKRRERGLFVIEGRKELRFAVEAGYIVESLFFCRKLIDDGELAHFKSNKLFEVESDLYTKIAYRGKSEGVVAIAKVKNHPLSSIKLSSNPLLLILEGVEKPGNIGAAVRSADALGIDAIVLCDLQTDLYNPNVVRSSVGGIFTTQIALSTSQEAFSWLRSNKINIVSAQLQNSIPYYNVDMSGALALLFGNEKRGLSTFWRERADERVIIPMRGKLDSLNLSVSVAILCHQAIRERVEKSNSCV
ncbi:MAG: RNA methyltransferase [Bacteroidales bacterium]